MSVVHTHSPGVIPFSVSNVPLRAMFHNPSFLAVGVPVWDIRKDFGDTNMLVSNSAIGKSLAAALGDKPVVLMRGHGDVTVGPTVKMAVFRAYYTDVNAKLQAQALALGGEPNYLTPGEGAKADQDQFRCHGPDLEPVANEDFADARQIVRVPARAASRQNIERQKPRLAPGFLSEVISLQPHSETPPIVSEALHASPDR